MRAVGSLAALLVAGLALGAATASADERYSLLVPPEAGEAPEVAALSDASGAAQRESQSRYHLSVRSTHDTAALDQIDNTFGGSRLFEAVGGYRQEIGGGFGYGLNVGVGVETRSDWSDLGPASESTAYFTDFSFGPTFASGRFDSQFRVGLRQSLSGESDGLGFGYGDRSRDVGRTMGYLSLDGRMRLQNRSELSLSLYYDDYSLNAADDWMADRLEFEGASRDRASSVIGLEMGLTF
ncbi:hypothetical protein [Thioalkalivibrio sp. ALJ16]|uniref:hypothetical protein n=1 Tax=Thioalkalivibrio sp. ALJ16 TaxID=1158762 RepID=UPI00035C2266